MGSEVYRALIGFTEVFELGLLAVLNGLCWTLQALTGFYSYFRAAFDRAEDQDLASLALG